MVGFVLGPIGCYLRTRVAETPAFERSVEKQAISHAPLTEALSMHGRKIAQAFGLSIIAIVANYVMIVCMPTYAIKTLNISADHALLSATLANLAVMVLTPFMGALSDRIGRRPMIGASSVLYLLLGGGTFQLLSIAQLVVAVIQSLYTGTIPVILSEMFPTRVRYTALSVSHGFSVAIFGGFSPFAATWLISSTGSPLSPAYLVMAAGAASALSIWSMKECKIDPLG